MKKHIYVAFFCITITSCEPAYRLYIHNNSQHTVFARFDKPVESIFDKSAPIYDSILKNRIDNGLPIYKIEPNGYFQFLTRLGTIPSQSALPYEKIEVIMMKDTLYFKSKREILDNLQKSKKRMYVLEITKVQ